MAEWLLLSAYTMERKWLLSVFIHRINMRTLFFRQVNKTLSDFSEYKLIIGTDMNTILDKKLDKIGSSYNNRQSMKALALLMSDFDLKDVWRERNLSLKEYTFFCNRHKSYSRIDFVLISQQLMPLVQSIEIKHNYD